MVKITKIRNNEILFFADDSKFADWENLPISKYRAISYSRNPRSNPQDVVLYLAYINDQLVGYRSVMADFVFVGGVMIKVGWLSGNWVHEDYRRKGIATFLFDEAYKDWGNRLLYTNYAPESKAVYDKSGRFSLIASRAGTRFYLRSCLSSLLPVRSTVFKQSTYALKAIDFLMNLINPIPLAVGRLRPKQGVEVECLSMPDNEIFHFLEVVCRPTFTQRTRTEFQWILDYPWLVSSPKGNQMREKYFFSSNPKRFCQSFIKVSEDKRLLGFLMLNLNDNKLSIPYCSFGVNDAELMSRVLLTFAVRFNVSMITIYQHGLVEALKKRWLIRLFSKNRIQNYFATKELARQLDGLQVSFNDGDGDCTFT